MLLSPACFLGGEERFVQRHDTAGLNIADGQQRVAFILRHGFRSGHRHSTKKDEEPPRVLAEVGAIRHRRTANLTGR